MIRSLPFKHAARRSPVNRVRLQVESLEERTLLSGGALDPTFGQGGVSRLSSNSLPSFFNGRIALQSDGKIIVGGESNDIGLGYPSGFAVARLNSDGSLDQHFGAGGQVIVNAPPYTDTAELGAIAVQSDGKILIVGSLSWRVLDVVRLNSDGSLDTSFGINGTGHEEFYSGPVASTTFADARALTVQPDGKIIVTGSINDRFLAFRMNQNGSPDSSFGEDGEVLGREGDAAALALDPNGDIVLAGGGAGESGDFAALQRLHADGSVDNSFKQDQVLLGAEFSMASGVTIQPDGDIIVVGTQSDAPVISFQRLFVAGLLPDGTPDPAFHSFAAPSYHDSSISETADGVLLRTDGRIIVFGKSRSPADDGMIIAYGDMGSLPIPPSPVSTAVIVYQLLPDGRLDPEFGEAGETVVAQEPTTPYPYDSSFGAVAGVLQPDGKLLINTIQLDPDYPFPNYETIVARLTAKNEPVQPLANPHDDDSNKQPGDITTDHLADLSQDLVSVSSSSSVNLQDNTSSPRNGLGPHEESRYVVGTATANAASSRGTGPVLVSRDASLISIAVLTVPNSSIPAAEERQLTPTSSVVSALAAANTMAVATWPAYRPEIARAVLAAPSGGGAGSIADDAKPANGTIDTTVSSVGDFSVRLGTPIVPIREPSEAVGLDAVLSPDWVVPPLLDAYFASPPVLEFYSESGRTVCDTDTARPASSPAPSLAIALLLLGSTLSAETRTRSGRPTLASR
jgi:uncharacterized delta-60 repeat protein